MHPTSRIHNPTHLPRLQRERRLLKFFLHIARAEETPTRTVSASIQNLETTPPFPQHHPPTLLFAPSRYHNLFPHPSNLQQPPTNKSKKKKKRNLQIPLLPRTTTITLPDSQLPQPLPPPNPLLKPHQHPHRLLFTPRNPLLLPTTRPSAPRMLDQ